MCGWSWQPAWLKINWARYAELFSFDPRQGIFKRFEKTYLGKPPASRLKEIES